MIYSRRIATVGFLLAGAGLNPLRAQESVPQIITSGVGEVVVAPDMAEARLTIENGGSTASEAARTNAQGLEAVVRSLSERGIPRDSLPTVGYVVSPRYEMRNGRRVLSGYVAVATLRLRVWKLDELGELIDAGLAAGATGLSSLNFDTSRRNDVRREALQIAVAEARGDALVMAEAAGGSLGTLVRLSNQTGGGGMPPRLSEGVMMQSMASADAPQITPDDVVVRVSVNGVWNFIP